MRLARVALRPLINFAVSIYGQYSTRIEWAFLQIPSNQRLTLQYLRIYFFNHFITIDLEEIIRGFKTDVIDQSVTILTEISYSDGPKLSVAEIEATVYTWDYYQQIVYNYIQAMDGVDIENGSDDSGVVKELISIIELNREMELELIVETLQTRVAKFVRYCGTALSDYSIVQRLQIEFSNRKFANAVVCMAGINQVDASSEVIFNFINTYETVFDGFLAAVDFQTVFNIELDIDSLYFRFYSAVKINIFQRCYASFFNHHIVDLDLENSIKQFFFYFDGLDLESDISLQAQIRGIFYNLGPKLTNVISSSQLNEIRALTYLPEKSFNSLIFGLKILRLFEHEVDADFTFGMFNQLDVCNQVDWDLTRTELNVQSFYNQVVDEAVLTVDSTVDTHVITYVKSNYEELPKEFVVHDSWTISHGP